MGKKNNLESNTTNKRYGKPLIKSAYFLCGFFMQIIRSAKKEIAMFNIIVKHITSRIKNLLDGYSKSRYIVLRDTI